MEKFSPQDFKNILINQNSKDFPGFNLPEKKDYREYGNAAVNRAIKSIADSGRISDKSISDLKRALYPGVLIPNLSEVSYIKNPGPDTFTPEKFKTYFNEIFSALEALPPASRFTTAAAEGGPSAFVPPSAAAAAGAAGAAAAVVVAPLRVAASAADAAARATGAVAGAPGAALEAIAGPNPLSALGSFVGSAFLGVADAASAVARTASDIADGYSRSVELANSRRDLETGASASGLEQAIRQCFEGGRDIRELMRCNDDHSRALLKVLHEFEAKWGHRQSNPENCEELILFSFLCIEIKNMADKSPLEKMELYTRALLKVGVFAKREIDSITREIPATDFDEQPKLQKFERVQGILGRMGPFFREKI